MASEVTRSSAEAMLLSFAIRRMGVRSGFSEELAEWFAI
jgi:hypothetical protein